MAVVGFYSTDFKLYDLRTNTIHFEDKCKNGAASVQCDRPDIEINKIIVTSLESKFGCYKIMRR